MTINPYRIGGGMFAFDDPVTGLIREPFIGGANYHLDKFAGNRNDCVIAFSGNEIPDYDVKLKLQDTDKLSGSNYDDQDGRNVWLCPALFKYFETAPKKLYIKNMTLVEGGERFIKGEIT
tara:strand:- start:1213 stop:1572 length:360 start_codon:yes stop_codon:yes gene_type:complete